MSRADSLVVAVDMTTRSEQTTVGRELAAWLKAMVEKRGGKNELKPANLYQGCVHAWNAYREGKTIQTIKFDARKGLYDVHE